MSVTPDDPTGYTRHTLMGILAGLFTCFVHVVAFMYFVVCEKIIRQSVLSGQLTATHAERAMLKGRAIKASMAGIGLMLLTTLLGGAAIAQYDPRHHYVSAIVTLAGTLAVFTRQFVLIDEVDEISRRRSGARRRNIRRAGHRPALDLHFARMGACL